jgi:UDP-glucose 4-epimerase
MAMTTVLVTGGCGFIGRPLVRRLLDQGCRVTVLDDFSTGLPDCLPAHANLRVLRGCVTDPDAIREAARGAVQIFHLASVVGQLNVWRAPDWTVRVSMDSVRHLNRYAPEALLVLFSSSAVYGLAGDELCREDVVPDEAGLLAHDGGSPGYAFGKYRSEQLAAGRAPGSWLTVRPFNVIGPGQRGTYGMVVPRLLRSALAGDPVTIYGDGTQRRSFGDVETFAGHLLQLVEAWRAERQPPTLFNIGNRTEFSIEELVAVIERVVSRPLTRRYVPYDQVYPGRSDVLRRRPSLDRIEALLGNLDWPPLEQVIAGMVDESERDVAVAPVATACAG